MILALLAAQPAPIIVTGQPLEETEAQVVLTAEDAETLSSGRVEELLARAPNLSSFRRADARSVHPTSQGLTLRGLGGNSASRVALTIDGVPQADPFGGWINFASMDPVAIDRLAIRYGADTQPGAVAGSIAIDTISRTPRTIRVAYGGDDRWDISNSGHLEIGDGYLQSSSGFLESDGFIPVVEADRGPADRAARTEQRVSRWRFVYPVAGVEAQLGAAWFTDKRDRGFDGSDNRAEGLDVSLRLVERNGPLPFELTGWWQDRQFETRFAALDEDRATTRIVLDQYDVPATGLGVEGKVDLGAARLGAGWRKNEGTVAERFFFIDSDPTRERRAGGETRIASLFGEADAGPASLSLRVDRWDISNGFRAIEQLTDGASLEDASFADRDGTQWSGRLSIAERVDDVTFSVTASRGWRLPTLNELYRPFRVGADATAANEALEPETSIGVDLGARYESDALFASATIFWQRLDDAIANVPLDTGPGLFPGVGFVSGAGTYAQRRNLDAIESQGIELAAGWQDDDFDITLLYGFADATVSASGDAAAFDGNQPAQSPRHSGSLTGGWSGGDTRLQLTARLDGTRYDDLANLEKLDAAVSFDAYARTPLHEKLALELRAENVTDAEILTGFASDGSRERARGRTFWVGLKFTP
ncbi:TonB-dependent receptor [Sphingomicrobium sediminis]|uniref:TonB-dependent receptor n=1 Tax=Sphingomicrobium sediminis TaxID=2950949 RepID=A0A9X2EIX5_9SPHN|nr:TonB-dependent receptor [Sphingomicrobium sediminis]MCM8558367.1 TonB-dependent receptor [Sphingomicrobium sediminis]